MIERTEAALASSPNGSRRDTAYGSAVNLEWLVSEQGNRAACPGDRQVVSRRWDMCLHRWYAL